MGVLGEEVSRGREVEEVRVIEDIPVLLILQTCSGKDIFDNEMSDHLEMFTSFH